MASNSNSLPENWHYDYANKTVDNWPSWKKEIYEQNFRKENSNQTLKAVETNTSR